MKNDSPQLVVTGPSGMGKSALVANWLRDLEARKEQPYRIAYHFVGNGGNEGAHGQITHALAGEIRAAYGFEDEVKEDNITSEKTDDKELETLFLRVASEGDRPLLVVLDAVNQIADVDNAKQLNWLPVPPKNVRILFSTLEADKTMDVFRNRQYPLFTLQPLDLDKRRQLVVDYLHSFGKRLQPAQVERIITDSQCVNTLVLRTLLDELINFGVFERLDERIDYFLHRDTVEDFYDALLASYEADYVASGPDFVRHILTLIGVSRSGLSETELLGILNAGAPADSPRVSPLHWAQFFCAFRAHLAVHDGLITFGHSYVRSAVETRYNLASATAEREEIIDHFSGQTTPRALHELPHQLYALGVDRRLHEVLMDIDVFEHLYNNDRLALTKYWTRLQGEYSLEEYLPLVGGDRITIQLLALSDFCRESVIALDLAISYAEKGWEIVEDDDDLEEKAFVLNYLSQAYNVSCNFEKALEFALLTLRTRKSLHGNLHPSVAVSYNNVGMIYYNLGDYQQGLDSVLKALEIRRTIHADPHHETATCLNNVGLNYRMLDDYEHALKYGLEALSIRESIFGTRHFDTSVSYNNVGLAYCDLGDYPKALKYMQKAQRIREALLDNQHPELAAVYNNVGFIYSQLKDHANALEYELKALRIYENTFGICHADTAILHDNVGSTYSALGDCENALEYKLKALAIMEEIYGEQNINTAISYWNAGNVYCQTKEYAKALEFILRALDVFEDSQGTDHPSVIALYNDVAEIYDKLGKYSQSIDYHIKALNSREALYGELHPDTAASYDAIGKACNKLGNYQGMIEYHLKALDVYRALYGENDIDTARMANNVGMAYGYLGNHQKALEYVGRALEISTHIDMPYFVAVFHNRLAGAYAAAGDVENAIAHYEKAARLFKELGVADEAADNLQAAAELRAGGE